MHIDADFDDDQTSLLWKFVTGYQRYPCSETSPSMPQEMRHQTTVTTVTGKSPGRPEETNKNVWV